MKKLMGIALFSTILLAGCGAESSVSEQVPSNGTGNVTQVAHISNTELGSQAEANMYIDAFGNVVYTYSYRGIAVIPFQELTWEQIKMYEEKGAVFPEQLIQEKKENESK